MVEGSRRIGCNHSIKAMFPGRTQASPYRTYKLPEANHTASYEHRGDLKLFQFRDGFSYTLGITSYVSDFIDQYNDLRKKLNLPEIQLNAKDVEVIDFTTPQRRKLNYLLELDLGSSLEAITDNPLMIFFDAIEIVRKSDEWKQWRKEIKAIEE